MYSSIGMGLRIRTLKKSLQFITEWNDAIWTVMVEQAVVHSDGSIQQKFLIAYDRLMAKRESVLSDCKLMRSTLSDCPALDDDLGALNEEIQVVAELVKACVGENASAAQSQEEYAKKYNRLLARYEVATERVNELTAEKERKQRRDRDLRLFIASIKKQPLVLKEWDERLWVALVDRATVYRDGRIVFRFKCGNRCRAGGQMLRQFY